MRTFVKARVVVPGIHSWAAAPEQYRHLRQRHRHQFTFEVEFDLGDDLPLGGMALLHMGPQVETLLRTMFEEPEWHCLDFGEKGCEDLARFVLESFGAASSVTVWEDGVYGAGVRR